MIGTTSDAIAVATMKRFMLFILVPARVAALIEDWAVRHEP